MLIEGFENITLYPVSNDHEREKLRRVHEMRALAIKHNYEIFRERISRDCYSFTIPKLKFHYYENYG